MNKINHYYTVFSFTPAFFIFFLFYSCSKPGETNSAVMMNSLVPAPKEISCGTGELGLDGSWRIAFPGASEVNSQFFDYVSEQFQQLMD